jgi:ubiquinone biosynthesis protein COQ4
MDQGITERTGYKWLIAFRAVRALMRDPNDVEQVFKIVSSLPGRALERMVERLRSTPEGAQLLAHKPTLAVLRDRQRLAAMPEGSLGRAYLQFMIDENLNAETLEEADVSEDHAGELEFAWRYLRDTHDIWHVVTGYQGGMLGEPALQAFNFAQFWMPGTGFIVAMLFLMAGFKVPHRALPGASPGRPAGLTRHCCPARSRASRLDIARRLSARGARPSRSARPR